MSLPEINFKTIRLQGNQANAFEELCCQLAGDEASTARVRFVRKGAGGDAGVECFEILADGSEVGWQVKYYWDIGSMLSALDGSLTTALAKHTKMTRFIACFPFDLPDARKDNTITALTKWDEWRKKRIDDAAKSGRTIKIDAWDEHAIRNRLTGDNPRSAGRIAYWFDQELLTPSWFAATFERTKADLGKRYDPETHVDLPIRRAILALTGDASFFDELRDMSEAIASASAVPVAKGTAAENACDAAATLLAEAASNRDASYIPAVRDLVGKAEQAATALLQELVQASDEDDPTDDVDAASSLSARLRTIADALAQPSWELVDRTRLLVFGEAGSGKSHLLADACAHQLARGKPAIMVLGGRFAEAEPWGEIMRDLDLPRHYQTKQFLGALNAAGEAARVRSLIFIDALNEKNGQGIWPEHLAGLLHDIDQFPWIAAVLSCRTTYLNEVITDELDETKLPRIEHHGFSTAAVRAYLSRRGLTLPEAPLQARELQIPLFLRIYCDALDIEGQALLARGLGSVTGIFQTYTEAVTRRVDKSLGVAKHRQVASKGIDALAREMADTGRAEIPIDRADEIVRAVYDGQQMSRDLLFQLENEGLLATEPMILGGRPSTIVRFTFERMSDHEIVGDLLDRSADAGAQGLCAPDTPLRIALDSTNSYFVRGLLEALAVQVPERFGIELPDLPALPTELCPDDAFRKSLLERRTDAISGRTWELIEDRGGDALRYETLIALATEPEHPFNAHHIDSELRGMTMPVRDARWSVHLAENTKRALHLIEWVHSADQSAIAPERGKLTATQLTWFLTTTNREVRDKATKALVALFADRATLAMEMWKSFVSVDDGYVTERLVAALYGAALQGRWKEADLQAVAETLQQDLFAAGSPPTNLLLRDHAGALMRYAEERGVLPNSFDMASTQPPYSSPWPLEHVSDEVLGSFKRTYNDGQRFSDEIASSLNDGDFARYVLDQVVRNWSAAPRGTNPLPTSTDLRNQWLAEFTKSASAEEIAAYEQLVAEIAEIKGGGPVYASDKKKLRAAKKRFRNAVGSEKFEEWRARAEHWRDEGMYQSHSRNGPAEFNMAWARRWVNWRAHELGWSQKLHGDFDRRRGHGRMSHSVERIGKKYQWLATYELAARMEDNLAPLPDQSESGPHRLRNLDPSMLRERTEDDGWMRFTDSSFWVVPSPKFEARTPMEAVAWLNGAGAILDGPENIEVIGDNGTNWLVLTGFEIWRGGPEEARCETWRRVGCTVARKGDRDKLLSLLKGELMTDSHAMPVAGRSYHIHLGEHPWAWPDPHQTDGWINGWRPSGVDWNQPGVSVRPPTYEYLAESGSYDHSIDQNINLNLPAGWLMESLGIRLSDGRSIEYRDLKGNVLFMDPSVERVGRSAALVERKAFIDMLKREGLAAVWAVAGEKDVFGQPHSDGFGGRRSFTRIYYTDGSAIRSLDRLEHAEKPSKRQLALLLGSEQDGVVCNEEDDEYPADGQDQTGPYGDSEQE